MTTEEIKATISMPELLSSRYGIKANRTGYVCCPFHREDTPSLKIYKDHAHCFGCGWHGDLFKFVQDHEGVDFPTALEILGGDRDTAPEKSREAEARKQRQRLVSGIRTELRSLLADAITLCSKIERACRPTDSDEDYPETWVQAANDLTRLNYMWALIFIDQDFTWEGGAVNEIIELCRRYAG